MEAPVQSSLASVNPALASVGINPTQVAPTQADQTQTQPTPAVDFGKAPAAPADNGGGQPGSFASKLAQAATALGLPPGPGGWARSLVGGAVSALGDAAAV